MPRRIVRVPHALAEETEALRRGIGSIHEELGVTDRFPAEVTRAARAAAERPRLPALDRTDVPFVTIDPPSSRDLDQALHIERDGDGFRVHYAIADVAAFVAPGDAVDVEAHRRGETLYGASTKVPLHPPQLSEGAASLLPDQVCPALLWTSLVDANGEGVSVDVRRALVRSRAKLDYEGVQRSLDDGTAEETLRLLREVGRLRQAREVARGGVSLQLPDQEVRREGGRWVPVYRDPVPAEEWNAQISLLTGMGAAQLMLGAGVGLLRTLAPADPRDIRRLRRTARALRVDWPDGLAYPDLVRSLDPGRPRHAAMLTACTRLLRGSGYLAFDGEVPEEHRHAALAAPYAHVTAPLRRLADRYAGEVCVALCAGEPVPDWVRRRLPELPATMREADRRAARYERAVLDLVEAIVLADQVGSTYPAVVVQRDEEDPRRGVVVLREPAVEAKVRSTTELPLGTELDVRLVKADPGTRTVAFEPATDDAASAPRLTDG